MQVRISPALFVLTVGCGSTESSSPSPVDSSTDAADTFVAKDTSVADSTIDSSIEDAGTDTSEPKDTSKGVDAGPILVGPVCGTTTCKGATEVGATCRSAADWLTTVTGKCAADGLEVVYFEPGDDCTGGHKIAKYSCCPKGTPTVVISPASYPACPPLFDSVPVGGTCDTAAIVCNYPNKCGVIDQWHCKKGVWQPNTTCGCF